MPTIVFPPTVPAALVIGAPQDDARMHLPTDRVPIGVVLTRIDPTHFRCDFNRQVLRTPALLYPGDWVLSPTLPVLAVSAAAGESVDTVTIQTEEQGPHVYTALIYGVEAA